MVSTDNFPDRHPDQGQGENRRGSHRVDIRQGVRRSDPPEVEGVVDHRPEEVRGGDQSLAVVQTPDRGIVGGLGADHQGGEGRGLWGYSQNGLKNVRPDFAAATTAMRQGGQFGFG